MVKRKSFPASNGAFQVRILVEALDWIEERDEDGRATRWATGTGWKPVEHLQCLAGSTPAPSALRVDRLLPGQLDSQWELPANYARRDAAMPRRLNE
jgi:hypothetical protein